MEYSSAVSVENDEYRYPIRKTNPDDTRYLQQDIV